MTVSLTLENKQLVKDVLGDMAVDLEVAVNNSGENVIIVKAWITAHPEKPGQMLRFLHVYNKLAELLEKK